MMRIAVLCMKLKNKTESLLLNIINNIVLTLITLIQLQFVISSSR